MDDTKLKKIGAELSKARAKRDEWDRKVKDPASMTWCMRQTCPRKTLRN